MAFEAFLDALMSRDATQVGALLAPDAVIEFPFAPDGAPERVVGRADIEHYFVKAFAAKTPIAFTGLTFRHFADSQEVFAEFKSEMEANAERRRYHNRYCAILRVGPAGIELFREWYDPAVDAELRKTAHADTAGPAVS
ncbi:nuclear transport factor 2 family protein [Candidatus Poriferisocius sp.]|uniref:nuclear transport factor 2 family protein n=1 Tax=Candidatus Poriferisocius sp. TaxID=3101276 RepID=UPI003B5ABC9D